MNSVNKKKENCDTCLFFGPDGKCYRYPPTVTTVHEVYIGTYPRFASPKVAPDAWCGEWKKDG